MRTPTTIELMMVVGATADQLAKPVECELRGEPVSEDVQPRDALQWEATLFALHVLDRWSLSRLGFAGRELAMGGVQAAIAEGLDPEFVDAMRDGFNEYQRQLAGFAQLLPKEGGNLKGTFCWEFAKTMIGKFAPDRLELLAMFSVASSQATVFLFSCCDKIAASQLP